MNRYEPTAKEKKEIEEKLKAFMEYENPKPRNRAERRAYERKNRKRYR